MTILNKVIEHKMIGILRGYGTEDTIKIVDTLNRNDFKVIEVALNSPNAKATLKTLKETFGEELVLGAGTVLTLEDAQVCLDIGTDFLLSPVYNEEILKFSVEHNILYIPGCYTPTEIYNAHTSGAKLIKVFPAGQLKSIYIKDVLAPMNDLSLLPTGGVTADNINAFLDAGAKAVGVNSALVPSKREVDKSLMEEITKNVQKFKEALDKNED
ncbi:bifunctional 4-hydroxy-2-oxoglutarate aldolase/2-dehydro-3-deoxy-phosphogluconate aldolase [Virgibacillus natechei]